MEPSGNNPPTDDRWIDSLKSRENIVDNSLELRHGALAITASSLGQQQYCEQKVEMSLTHEEIQTESKLAGERLHEELLPMEKTTLDALIEDILTKKTYTASFPLAAKYNGYLLAGIPDAVIFRLGKPAFILELKTTRRNPTVLWPSQRVQVTTYGMLLELMGFDCSDLELSVFTLKRTKEPTEDQKKQFLGKAVWVLIGEKTKELVSSLKGALAIHTFHYNPKEARDNIEPSIGYWLKQREPVPTRNPRKCKPCEFNDICPFSLV